MKVGNYVASARTLSLAIIALGYLGWQLGMFHNDRADLYAKVVDVATIGWIDQRVSAKQPPFDTWDQTSPLEVPVSPFGVLRIGNPTKRAIADRPANSSPMRVSVVGPAGQYTTRAARFSDDDIGKRDKAWPTVARELGTRLDGQIVEKNAKSPAASIGRAGPWLC